MRQCVGLYEICRDPETIAAILFLGWHISILIERENVRARDRLASAGDCHDLRGSPGPSEPNEVVMKAFGKKPSGLRLERMQASALWGGDAFRNIHPMLPGLRDRDAASPTVSDFLCGGDRRVPRGQLPSANPSAIWAKPPT